MAAAGLDALVLHDPGTIRWATGAHPGIATSWRRAGAGFVLVPADPNEPLGAVVGDLEAERFRSSAGITDVSTVPIWVETADLTGLTDMPVTDAVSWVHADRMIGLRPGTFDREKGMARLSDLVNQRRLATARIGLEEALLPLADAPAFRAAMPGVAWHHGSRVVERLRMIKTPDEQAKLMLGARASEQGVLVLKASLRTGLTNAEMVEIWKTAALDAARMLGAKGPIDAWAYISIGPDGFQPGGPLIEGDSIKVDVGLVVDGYSSDSARTFMFRGDNDSARTIYSALRRGFDAGRQLLMPGAKLSEIHRATLSTIQSAGFPTYARGHFGHSVGASVWSEEWPFIASDEETVLESGMVMAFETPFYVRGVGGFMIEDQFTITPHGANPAWSLPLDLEVIG